MAWVNWPRRGPAEVPAGKLGVDWNAGRALAATATDDKCRPVLLDEPHAELPLAISLEGRSPTVGRPGLSLVRRLPHLACTGYLASLGKDREWAAGRHRLNPADALALSFGRIKSAAASFESVYMGLPAYLAPSQVSRLRTIAIKEQLPLRGTVSTPLAVAASQVSALLGAPSATPQAATDGVVPLHRPGISKLPADVMVVDADDEVLTVGLFRIEPTQAIHLGTLPFPALGLRHWRDRLVNALSDRCVRVCRRDPRDSGEAEQSLFEQIEAGLDHAAAGKPVTLTVRAAHWYQDLTVQPAEWACCVAAQRRAAVAGVRDLLGRGSVGEPPRAVWVTHDVGRLPNLLHAIEQNVPERTSVRVLAPEAAACAVADLAARWPGGEHLDATIPLPETAALTIARPRMPSAASRR